MEVSGRILPKHIMSPIKNFALNYETLNVYGTFSEGDTIIGTVTFTLTKEKKVESLFIKVKGDAHVSWTEEWGETETTYSDHKRYFKEKHFLVAKKASGGTKKCFGTLMCLSIVTQCGFFKY